MADSEKCSRNRDEAASMLYPFGERNLYDKYLWCGDIGMDTGDTARCLDADKHNKNEHFVMCHVPS